MKPGCGLFGCFVGFNLRASLEDAHAKELLCSVCNLLLGSGDSTYLPVPSSFSQGKQSGSDTISLAPLPEVWPSLCLAITVGSFIHLNIDTDSTSLGLAFPTCPLPWWSDGEAAQLALG